MWVLHTWPQQALGQSYLADSEKQLQHLCWQPLLDAGAAGHPPQRASSSASPPTTTKQASAASHSHYWHDTAISSMQMATPS